jgi:hypothetical protein
MMDPRSSRVGTDLRVIGSNVMMARLDHDGDAGQRLFHDGLGRLPNGA